MNIQLLLTSLYKEISTTTDTSQMQMLAKAVERLNVGTVKSVATVAALPAASLSNEGELYFVVADERMYWSTGTEWKYLTQQPPKSIWTWGGNTVGQLGDGTTTSKSSPVSVAGGFTDWCAVSAGYKHALGVRTNGTAWAWGCGANGRLGDNTTVSKTSPVQVCGGFTNWCDVSAGDTHSLGIRSDGTAWAWGSNVCGQLGDGTVVDKSSPVSVVGNITDWCDISAGAIHSLGIRSNGTAWAWGSNGAGGTLGNNSTANTSSPVSVVGGFTDWSRVSAGAGHSLGLRANGTIWAWGFGICGKLGDGTITNRLSPVQICGGITNWCQISASSGLHSLALRTDGTAWAWGSNTFGQLGDNSSVNKCSPVAVVGGITNWCQVTAGYFHSLGIRTDGTAWAWGSNSNGSLGDCTVATKSSPVTVVGGFTDWCRVSAGCTFSVGVRVPSA